MEQYERNADAKYKTHIATKGFHTWEQVLEEVDNAANQYKDASTFWGKLRQGFRKFGINNDALTAWIDLLPSQSQYFSIICGGLKLILGVGCPG